MEQKKFYWTATSTDGNLEFGKSECFATAQECYENMRNEVLENAKDFADYYDFHDGSWDEENPRIKVTFSFGEKEIVCKCYHTTYTYTMHEMTAKDLVQLDDEQSDLVQNIGFLIKKAQERGVAFIHDADSGFFVALNTNEIRGWQLEECDPDWNGGKEAVATGDLTAVSTDFITCFEGSILVKV